MSRYIPKSSICLVVDLTQVCAIMQSVAQKKGGREKEKEKEKEKKARRNNRNNDCTHLTAKKHKPAGPESRISYLWKAQMRYRTCRVARQLLLYVFVERQTTRQREGRMKKPKATSVSPDLPAIS
ncbi:hypothetical protein LX36DRAFT_649068 [Colletotrichum falcatum]|nr:hypothetical protein LX36DRAFT_649068 [Colletotrichum falcatum]